MRWRGFRTRFRDQELSYNLTQLGSGQASHNNSAPNRKRTKKYVRMDESRSGVRIEGAQGCLEGTTYGSGGYDRRSVSGTGLQQVTRAPSPLEDVNFKLLGK